MGCRAQWTALEEVIHGRRTSQANTIRKSKASSFLGRGFVVDPELQTRGPYKGPFDQAQSFVFCDST